jgi:hypothetical protein
MVSIIPKECNKNTESINTWVKTKGNNQALLSNLLWDTVNLYLVCLI